jgi:hypothetical protein
MFGIILLPGGIFDDMDNFGEYPFGLCRKLNLMCRKELKFYNISVGNG